MSVLFFGKLTVDDIRSYIEENMPGQFELNNSNLKKIAEHFSIPESEAFGPHPTKIGSSFIYHVIYSNVCYRKYELVKKNTFLIESKVKKTNSNSGFEFESIEATIEFLNVVKNTNKSKISKITVLVE